VKIHLLRTDELQKEGADIEALCGNRIAKARFPFAATTEFGDALTLNALLICAKCYAIRGTGRYVYGLVNGQEAMTEQVCGGATASDRN
jgi:hypothetical protein